MKLKNKQLLLSSLKYVGRGALGAIGAIVVYLLVISLIYRYAGSTIAANLLAVRTQPEHITRDSFQDI